MVILLPCLKNGKMFCWAIHPPWPPLPVLIIWLCLLCSKHNHFSLEHKHALLDNGALWGVDGHISPLQRTTFGSGSRALCFITLSMATSLVLRCSNSAGACTRWWEKHWMIVIMCRCLSGTTFFQRALLFCWPQLFCVSRSNSDFLFLPPFYEEQVNARFSDSYTEWPCSSVWSPFREKYFCVNYGWMLYGHEWQDISI